MSDTSKYEGHTEGPWVATQIKRSEYPDEYIIESGDGMLMTGFVGLGNDGVNAKLMVDAPLLLAEVKRLRKEINQLPIDLHESLDMILEAHHPEVRESVMAMFGDAWGNNLTGYGE